MGNTYYLYIIKAIIQKTTTMINPTDPASPCIESINHGGVIQIQTSDAGMDIRTKIAAMAMQGYVSADHAANSVIRYCDLASWSVSMADALIEELNKTQ